MVFSEKNVHSFFVAGVVLKGVHAIIEIVGGVVLLFVSQQFLVRVIYLVTQGELSEDPRDWIATSLIHVAQNLTIGEQNFAAFYLLSHGILKGLLAWNLLKERLWAYPVAIGVFGLFILYQTYRYQITHAVGLILLTLFDGVVMWLTWHEYNKKKALVF